MSCLACSVPKLVQFLIRAMDFLRSGSAGFSLSLGLLVSAGVPPYCEVTASSTSSALISSSTSTSCITAFIGDGYCDSEFNSEECGTLGSLPLSVDTNMRAHRPGSLSRERPRHHHMHSAQLLDAIIFGGTYHSDSNKKLFVVFEGELSSRLGCEKKAGVPSMVLQSKQFFSGY